MGSISDPLLLPSSLISAADELPIVRLPHPRTRLPALFVIRPGQGFWEVQSIVSPPTASRSWFFQPLDQEKPELLLSRNGGRLLFVTAFDPFFLLLGLFFGLSQPDNPFETGEPNKSRRGHFEQMDVLLDRFQETWMFSDCSGGPTLTDFELFAAEALQPKTLCRVCEALEQDSTTTLWRLDPAKVVQNIEHKVDTLAKTGLAAKGEDNTVWTRLAKKEGLLAVNGTSDEPLLLEEIYRKLGFHMVQAYLPISLFDHLNQAAFQFPSLDAFLKRQVSLGDPLEIGRRSEPDTSKSGKLAPKRIKKEAPRGNRTLGDMWTISSSKTNNALKNNSKGG
ncbi:hypothetical protein O181_017550 [Austropuccinia psidii MF-1]|uniref:Rnh202 triple barrel domain-containing protein n=1 Tax=Austropuccinia psidii MF-1 TaxID=1389203 RepID=A0A9Q3GT50_9BASI|nr:hypothetical protein [Austropuccinia psidii MF-1]